MLSKLAWGTDFISTFQALTYALVHGVTEFLPLGSTAHQNILTYVTGWPEPPAALLGTLAIASLLAVLIYFIHDWASMFSSLLGVLFYRKKPMTMDERMPLFILMAAIPLVVAWYYLHETIHQTFSTLPMILGSLAGFGVLLGFADSWSKRNKGMYDWNVIDSLVVGVLSILALIPGCDRRTATLFGGFMRNYSREAATKFGYYVAAPYLLASAIAQFKGFDWSSPPISSSGDELSWLSLGAAFTVAFFTSLLGIMTLTRNVQRIGMGQYVTWRLVLAAGMGAYYYWNTHGPIF